MQTLQRYLAAPQLRALQTAALGDDQDDPFPEIVADITARVRAELRAGGSVLSADALGIPAELHSAAAALVIAAAQTRLPSLELTPAQERAQRDALQLLDRYAAGKLRAPVPEVPEENAPVYGSDAFVVRARPYRVTAMRMRI